MHCSTLAWHLLPGHLYNTGTAGFCQVTARFGEVPDGGQDPAIAPTGLSDTLGGGDSGGYVSPALGTLWAHSVNVRIALERQAGRRYMKVS
jgi:hypothetical protein